MIYSSYSRGIQLNIFKSFRKLFCDGLQVAKIATFQNIFIKRFLKSFLLSSSGPSKAHFLAKPGQARPITEGGLEPCLGCTQPSSWSSFPILDVPRPSLQPSAPASERKKAKIWSTGLELTLIFLPPTHHHQNFLVSANRLNNHCMISN